MAAPAPAVARAAPSVAAAAAAPAPAAAARRARASRARRPADRVAAARAAAAAVAGRRRRRNGRRGGGAAGRGGTGGSGGAGTGGSAARYTCPIGLVHGAQSVEHHADEGRRRAAVRQPSTTTATTSETSRARSGSATRSTSRRSASGPNPPPARILRVPTTGAVSIAYATSGTNGLAIDLMGRLIGASHTAGARRSRSTSTNMTSTPIVSDVHGQTASTRPTISPSAATGRSTSPIPTSRRRARARRR